MKIKVFAVFFITLVLLTGCGTSTGSGETSKDIDQIKISFVPSAPAEDIMTATKPLEDLIKEEMSKMDYTIGSVSIDVGTSYEAVGEALASGTTDLGFIPGGTYVLYEEDGVEPILTATRDGLSKDFEDAKSWNNGEPTEPNKEEPATYYRSLTVAGPSEKGQELADKVNNDEEITWEDLDSANVCVQSPSSSSGYLYPAKKIIDTYEGKTIDDLSSVVETKGYPDALGRLASGQCDITPIYADARMDYQKDWTTTYNRDKSIWEETNVIAVTDPIMNDTISISANSSLYSEQFIEDFQTAMMNIAKTDEGKKVISIYSHTGYQIADPKDYDPEREVQAEVVA